MSVSAPVLIFDSGLGGLTIYDQVRQLMPQQPLAYLADDAGFPYGDLTEDACKARVVHVVSEAIARLRPALVIVACNTASTIALGALRASLGVPFVGTVPAVKPAAAASTTGLISVLGTPATISRDYTRELIAAHAASSDVTLVGASQLARLAERFLAEGNTDEAAVKAEIAPCFRQVGDRRTDCIALACTHYPLLLDVFQRVAPWPVTWIDPAPAVARRAQSLLGQGAVSPQNEKLMPFFLTSGDHPMAHLQNALAKRGLVTAEGLKIPFAG